MSSTTQSPNWREILGARSTITGKQEYLTSTNGVLNVSSSGGGGGGAVTIADGADITQGALADAAVTAGSSGSVSGKLRQISSDISSINTKTPTLGQALAAASVPVILPSATITTLTPPGAIVGFALDATLTGGTQQTRITDGTNIASILKSDGTAAGQNSQMIASGYLSQSFSIASVTTSTAVDVGNYSWVSIHIVTQYTGSTPTIAWQGSNDNTNWISMSLIQPLSTLSSGSTSTTSSAVVFAGPLNFRYFRLNFTGTYSSGTATGTIVFSTTPRQMININGQVAINGTNTVQGGKTNNNAAPGATNIGVLPAIANAAIPSWTEGNQVALSTDLLGSLRASMNASTTGGYTYSHISTSTTTTVKSGAGTLHIINVNSLGTVASSTTVYDSTTGSGTVIGIINTLTLAGPFHFDIAFATGLTLVTTGTVAPDITVSYK